MRFITLNTDEQIISAFTLMKQLVPSLSDEKAFLEIVRRKQTNHGYNLIALQQDNTYVSLAGYRYNEYYATGLFLFIDDLVTLEALRSKGYGEKLFNHIVELARTEGCSEIHLDTSINLNLAHKFYYRLGMKISHFHLTIPVDQTI